MPEIFFPSEWLKIDVNVKHGEHIKFLDVGEYDEETERWTFLVGIIRDGRVAEQKKFGLNKTNFGNINQAYGRNSDDWVGKEMLVNKHKVRNPSAGGALVDGILLTAPNTTPEGDIINE